MGKKSLNEIFSWLPLCTPKMEDEADVSVLCETNGLANMQNLDATNMSKLGQQDSSSVIYEMIVELEALSIQHIASLQQGNGVDVNCALHFGQDVQGKNSDFSDIDYDPARPIRIPAPPLPKRFHRQRKNAQQ